MEERNAPVQRQTQPRRRAGRTAGRIFGKIVGNLFLLLFTMVLVGACTAAIFGYIFKTYVEETVMPTVQVRAEDYTLAQSSIIYYHDDDVTENDGWVEYQVIHGLENRILVTMDQIPDALWQATVAIEDQRFFQHNGVDWKRTGGAVLSTLTGGRIYGGSTITQQLLKNMTGDNKPYINRKIREVFRALEFEKNYTKEQILEYYLNFIYLGMNCYGVQTAAQYYFGKDVSELSVAECASLIAITNNPSMYGPMYNIKVPIKRDDGTTVYKTPRELNKQRQELILDKMADEEILDPQTGKPFLTKEQAEAAKRETLHFVERTGTAEDMETESDSNTRQYNSWFVDQVILDVSADLAEQMGISEKAARVLLHNSGYHVYTTLDPRVQSIAESVYEDRSNLDLTSKDGQTIRSGITILDPHTGNIVAIVGDMGEKTGNLLLSFATTRKQVGSSIKPLTVYSPALDAGAVNPGTAFDNYPVMLLNGNPWPKNSPSRYTGWTSVEVGVQNSINTIAVQTLMALGVENSYEFATENLNLSLDPRDAALSPLGMGGLTYGLSTVEMAGAYGAIANNGVYNSPKTYLRVEDGDGNVILENEGDSHVAMKETTAYLMTKMLQRVVTSGTGTSARFSGQPIAGKTGTTTDNYDRYFVGFTPYYVAAVWTGYQYNAKINYSGNPSITMWKKVMEKIHEGLPEGSFDKPTSGLKTIQICKDSGLLATDACQADVRGSRVVSVEVAAGTEPTESCTLHAMRRYCTEGKCLATEFCPEESVTEVGLLDYVRENYGASITAEDDPYLIINMEKAIGIVRDENGEVIPRALDEFGMPVDTGTPYGCPVHTHAAQVEDPEDPNGWNEHWSDPEDPEAPTDPSGTTEPPVTPTDPETPTEPTKPDPVDPEDANGDWWSGLW